MIEPKSDTWCVHFTGVMNKTCKAGMIYRDMWDANRQLPCILGDGSTTVCQHLQRPTPEQVALHEQEIEDMLKKFFGAMNSGNCPHCGKVLESERQIGRCVYGSCGCRLWQGKARTVAKRRELQADNA
jgi:hypothetical protein